MKMRPPAIPLITIDPNFSVWSPSDKLYDSTPIHWTAKPNTLRGSVNIDGEELRFMGTGTLPSIKQTFFDMSTLVSDYRFENDKIILEISFFTSLFTDDLYRLSRPVSYMSARYTSKDGKAHKVSLTLSASEELCINLKGEESVTVEKLSLDNETSAIRMGSESQKVLWRSGDDLRIDWGYIYLASKGEAVTYTYRDDDMTFISIKVGLTEREKEYIAIAYDDIYSINYFGNSRRGYWTERWSTIEEAIVSALDESNEILEKCRNFSAELTDKATAAGGEKYADLVSLAYRQTIAAHKLITDLDGNLIFICKECLSGGHSATVDVTYPSSPFMLLYNVELLKATLRPIFKFAATDKWKYDFAPHDIGTYPIVGQQRYGLREGGIHLLEMQMPVEECGNMLILMANITLFEGNTDFVKPHLPILDQWVKYLIKYGEDPENQLCSDDFAGHLAHNCNLSLKAIMGIAGYSLILGALGQKSDADEYMAIAKNMADSWVMRAANSDGSFRLAFDLPDTSGMKYNIIWDKLWGLGLFEPYMLYSEFCSSKKHINPYGMTFDSLHTYTKSDWLVWTAMLAPTKEEFEEFIAPLWLSYHKSLSRLPMNDFYDTVTSLAMGCRNRSVVGGIFIKLLEERFKEILE